ncbi:MAG TPA: class I SAM-dependent methyltransferase, partial [Acidimicrobiia bacterium]|nr:class I SAM-dependent methyltransferase [Acidimicrobiia bacterium]
SRMVDVIGEHLDGMTSVVDVACGSGLYGLHLRAVSESVYGIDHDPELCASARSTGAYDQVACDTIEQIGRHFESVDAVFCSEFLEHVPPANLRGLLDAIEAIATTRIVVTVPNPLSPHFRHDPTHIGRYSVFSMRRTLNDGGRFVYRLLPLGFSEVERRQRRWMGLLQPLSRRVAVLSPTVLYVGDRVS